jgi:hypothetical protein
LEVLRSEIISHFLLFSINRDTKNKTKKQKKKGKKEKDITDVLAISFAFSVIFQLSTGRWGHACMHPRAGRGIGGWGKGPDDWFGGV